MSVEIIKMREKTIKKNIDIISNKLNNRNRKRNKINKCRELTTNNYKINIF